MFCPACGKSEQHENTYCRQCGVFLPDFAEGGKRPISPEEHIKFNIVLSAMTAVVSFALSITLFSVFLGDKNASALIYITAGFLIAMGAWQMQTVWRNLQLKKHFRRRKNNAERQSPDAENLFQTVPTNNLLDEANFANAVPASVVENATRKLTEKIPRKSTQTEHQANRTV